MASPPSYRNRCAKAAVSVAPPARASRRSALATPIGRCVATPAGAKEEQCVLMQFVTAEDRENVGLTVIVLKTADKKSRIMRVLAPLGVLLPPAWAQDRRC